MSHTTYTYPQSTGTLALVDNTASAVREEEAGYRPFSHALLEYIDLVNEKLPRARAVAYLMEAEDDRAPEGTIEEASGLVAELIGEVMHAQKALEAAYYGERDRNRDK